MNKLFVYIVFGLCISFTGFAQQLFHDCPTEGNAKSAKIRLLNTKKNRYAFPALKDFDKNLTLTKMLQPGDDKNRWSEDKAGEIIGYVDEVKMTGPESCNCGAKEPELRDTHIEVVLDPMQNSKIQKVIVEITPRIREIMRNKGIDWSSKQLRAELKGRWVKFQGWLFYDHEHQDEAENTAPGRPRNWRATAWEIHPVTYMEVVTRPKR